MRYTCGTCIYSEASWLDDASNLILDLDSQYRRKALKNLHRENLCRLRSHIVEKTSIGRLSHDPNGLYVGKRSFLVN